MTRRLRAIRYIAVFMAIGAVGFGAFTAIFGLLSSDQEPHAFHNVIVAALLIVLSAPPVIAIARRPVGSAAPLIILAAVGVAAVGTMALAVTIDPYTAPFVVLVGVLWALAIPSFEAPPIQRPNFVLIGISLIAALALTPYILEQAGLQRTDHTSEHAMFFHWVEMAFYAAAIPLVGVLAGLWPASFRVAAWMAAVALLVVGIASLLLGSYASALSPILASIAIAAGAALLIVFELRPPAQTPRA